jgi:hypothetical protein
MLELRNPFISETLMHMLCETNYDPSLKSIIEKAKSADTNHSADFIRDYTDGWFHKYLKKVRPLLLKSEALKRNPRAY